MKDHELPEPPNTTVHEALAEASSASKASETSKNFSVRLPTQLKETAQFICERHATDLGSYLRECTRALVRDYGFKDEDEPSKQ